MTGSTAATKTVVENTACSIDAVASIEHVKANLEISVRTFEMHLPEPEKTEGLLALTNMMKRVAISNERPRVIMKECQLAINAESAPYMCRPANKRQRFQRIRKKTVDYGENPANLDSIYIPKALPVTYA